MKPCSRPLPWSRPILTLLVPVLILTGCDAAGSLGIGGLAPIAISPSDAAVNEGWTLQLRVVNGSDAGGNAREAGSPASYTWSSSNPSVATVQNGLVTATGPGEANITASSQAGSFARGTIRVTRTAEEIRILRGDGQASTVGLPLQDELEVQVLSGAGNPVSGSKVLFSVVQGAGELSSLVATTDDQGIARSFWTLGPVSGEQRVEVRPEARPEAAVAFSATAQPDRPERIDVRPQGVTLQMGSQFAFEVVVEDRFGNTVGSPKVRWTSDDESVAVVDSEGRVRSVSGGETSVSATLLDDGFGMASSANGHLALSPGNGNGNARGRVRVEEAEGEDASLTIISGDGQTGIVGAILPEDLEIWVLDGTGSPIRNRDITWAVRSGGGEVVNAASKTNGQGRASARWRLGTTTGSGSLEVRVPGVGAVTFNASAIAGPLATVRVLPESASVMVDGEQAYELVTTDAYGNPVQPSSTPAWSVGNEKVATLASPGKAKGRSSGTTSVTASISGVEGQSILKVEGESSSEGDTGDGGSAEVATISVTPTSATLNPGQTIELTATPLDSAGNPVAGANMEWASTNTSVVTVQATGSKALVTAVASGSAAVTATGDGVTGSSPFTVSSPNSSGLLPAFPGAEGWGATALNDSRKLPLKVHFVTSRAASGTGTLLEALNNTRSDQYDIIIFRTGGVFANPAARLNSSHVYIAGQTAPGDGVMIDGDGGTPVWFRGYRGNINDIVIRYLRIRGAQTSIEVSKGSRIVLDHMSFSRSSRYGLALQRFDSEWSSPISDVSVQNSIVAEMQAVHPTAFVLGGPVKDDALIGMSNISIQRNLLASNSHRNPSSAADNTLIANNVIYNWAIGAGRMSRRGTHDWVNNVAKRGPMTSSDRMYAVNPVCSDDWVVPPSIFAAGNIGPMSDNPDGDNWKDPTRQVACFSRTGDYVGQEVPSSWRRDQPQGWASATFAITLRSANHAFDSVLSDVGANQRLTCEGNWVSMQDAFDARVISETRTGTGPSASPSSAGSMPSYSQGTPCADADGDGLPDAWEMKFFGCATCASPGAVGRDGYLLIEHYLNGTNPN